MQQVVFDSYHIICHILCAPRYREKSSDINMIQSINQFMYTTKRNIPYPIGIVATDFVNREFATAVIESNYHETYVAPTYETPCLNGIDIPDNAEVALMSNIDSYQFNGMVKGTILQTFQDGTVRTIGTYNNTASSCNKLVYDVPITTGLKTCTEIQATEGIYSSCGQSVTTQGVTPFFIFFVFSPKS